ncbi:MAG: DUF6048 family protein [Mesonia hippocampi]|uniref:DUF6048 family protein n=1 Tax=Mesonia hippocampi TaxID=1628250 RepID=UPI003F9B87DD
MKILLTCIFIISSYFGFSQYTQDSIQLKDKYGFRVGADLSKPIRSFIDKDYTGFEIIGDYRVLKNYYLAAELGIEERYKEDPYLTYNTKGSYLKIGGNYNTYENWLDMQNELFVGFRYAFSNFSQELKQYTVYVTDPYFPADVRDIDKEFDGLNASWIELQLGIKTEVLNNLFLSVHVELKHLVSEKTPDNYANLHIPGFNKVYSSSKFGAGWGYGISYLIPVTKKTRKPTEIK